LPPSLGAKALPLLCRDADLDRVAQLIGIELDDASIRA
jgi:hypothetical protein